MSYEKDFILSFQFMPDRPRNKTDQPKVILSNGTFYTGDRLNGKKNGFGIQEWPDGSKLECYWKQDTATGKGRMTYSDGDIYEGDWADDQANGEGILIQVNGSKYKGGFKND